MYRTARRQLGPLVAKRFAVAFLLGALSVVGACKGFETNLQDTEVSLQETARQNYEAGEKMLEASRYVEAIKYFEHVKNKYPYSKYAVLAELRIADADFAREKWIEAADAYRIFVRFHPRHEKVAYATFRTALAYHKEIDEDVWFLPAAREKDQSAAREAIRAFDDYLLRFPEDEHAKEAKDLRTAARGRLAETDLYIAEFYVERARWQGAVWRFERVGRELHDTPQAAHALLRAAQIADSELHQKEDALRLYRQVLREHPDAPEAATAKSALALLQ